jgi:hypothetical protein
LKTISEDPQGWPKETDDDAMYAIVRIQISDIFGLDEVEFERLLISKAIEGTNVKDLEILGYRIIRAVGNHGLSIEVIGKKIFNKEEGSIKEADEIKVAVQSSHQYDAALRVLQTLPDEELDNQRCAVDELLKVGLSDMAKKISEMSPDEYHDFVVNNLDWDEDPKEKQN